MINWTFVRQVGPFSWLLRNCNRQFHKRVLRRDMTMKLPTGLRMILPLASHSASEAYVTGANTDWGSEAVFAKFADAGRDCLDVGAHIGYYSAYLSPLVRRVYAFEPSLENLRNLRKNAAIAGNIEVLDLAVSSYEGKATFYMGSGSAVGSLNDVGGEMTEVSVTTIDSFAAAHPALDVALIKIDVEGQDIEVLRGMQKTVANYQPLILTECDYSSDLVALCRRWNYGIFAFACDRKTLDTRFEQMRAVNADDWCKMLFLVPARLKLDFELLTKTGPNAR
ncbi:MAG: FkbM family methyltransferase [Edaphobacter sp.]